MDNCTIRRPVDPQGKRGGSVNNSPTVQSTVGLFISNTPTDNR